MGVGHLRNITHLSFRTFFSVLPSPNLLKELGLGEGHRRKQRALCYVSTYTPKAEGKSLPL